MSSLSEQQIVDDLNKNSMVFKLWRWVRPIVENPDNAITAQEIAFQNIKRQPVLIMKNVLKDLIADNPMEKINQLEQLCLIKISHCAKISRRLKISELIELVEDYDAKKENYVSFEESKSRFNIEVIKVQKQLGFSGFAYECNIFRFTDVVINYDISMHDDLIKKVKNYISSVPLQSNPMIKYTLRKLIEHEPFYSSSINIV